MLQVDISSEDTLSDEVVVHLAVFGPRMENWVPSEVNTAHVVAIEENPILDGNVQILKYPFQPNYFTGGNCRAPIFCLCA